MNYGQCQEYLEKIQTLGIKFGLDNVRTVLESLGNPHLCFPSAIIAGSNGKGSVCAMLVRILQEHGFRPGLYTSPHLICAEERMRIGDDRITQEDFCRILTLLHEKIEELIACRLLSSPPTYFEHLTCMAFQYFNEQNVDLAVLEVGMGGRFDATNVASPVVTAITGISKEHQNYLGETLSQIAFEKAGIIRKKIPVVCGTEIPEAYETIKLRAGDLHAPFIGVFDREGCFNASKGQERYHFSFSSPESIYEYSPGLAGRHQGRNAAVSLVVSEQLSRYWKPLDKEKMIRGIENAQWPGRLEYLSRNPLVILDGAHNEEGADSVRRYFEDFITQPVVLLFAAMTDKKIEKVADILFPLAEQVILTRFPFQKAASPKEIFERTLRYKDKTILEPDVQKAYHKALEIASPDGAVLVTGSLFLVGEIKKINSGGQC